MTAFARSGGAWVEAVPRARSAGAWTDEDDQLFVRSNGEWVLVYPEPTGDLLPPEALAVTDGPTNFSVTIGWTNPEQPVIDPTDVQVRLAELGAVWTEYVYPATSASWGALEPETTYVAQVRYIVREDGEVTLTSDTATVEFTTAAAPIGPPAEDPGSPGGTDTSWPLGGSTGNPTAPSTPDGCWWEWKLQILDQDTTTINWQDTGITGTQDGDADDITYDTTSLDNTRTYRMCIREACDTNSDGTADDFGDWSCSAPFAGAFDWGVTCGSVPLSPVVGYDAALDAVWAFPRYCAVGDGLDTTGIVDAISNTQIGKGADFAAIYTTEDGEWGVVADADGGITLTAGLAAITTAITAGLDFTIARRLRLSPGHSFSNGRTTTLASIGGGAIVIQMVETASAWYPTISFRLTSGYVTLSGSASPSSVVGTVQTITLTWDADGTKALLLDGVELDTDTSNADLHASVTVQPMYWTSEPPLGSTMQQLGWDRILTGDEILSLNGGINLALADTIAVGGSSSFIQLAVDVSRELLYVVNTAFGLRVYDISDPTDCTLVGSLAHVTGTVRCLTYVPEQQILVALMDNSGTDRMWSIDVSTPASPSTLQDWAHGSFYHQDAFAYDAGDNLFTMFGGGSSARIARYDISDPTNMSLAYISTTYYGQNAHCLKVDEDLLLLYNEDIGSNSMKVVDVSSRSSFSTVWSETGRGDVDEYQAVAVSPAHAYAFVWTTLGKLNSIDLSNGSIAANTAAFTHTPDQMAADGDFLVFVNPTSDKVSVISIADPLNIEEGEYVDITVDGEYNVAINGTLRLAFVSSPADNNVYVLRF